MLSARAARARAGARIRSQPGFTLVEMLVALACSTIVLIGLSTVLIFTLQQTQRTFTKVDASRQARMGLATIENELHSACVNGDPPIQAGSTATSLEFLSYYGSAANPTPVWHVIALNSGTLTDTTYTATYNGSGTGADWTQGAAPIQTTTLLTNVAQNGSTPVFQYYAYAPDGGDSSGDTYWIIPDGTSLPPGGTGTPPNTPLSTTAGLSQSDALNTVEVVINLLVGATANSLSNPSLTGVDAPVTDSISLRLTTPPDVVMAGAAATGYGPCE